ncbi:MAG: class I SAM-dependent methyltransferase [Longimicrobiales bacterium]
MQEIVDHYERGREADRLSRGAGELERVRTLEILQRYLPPPPAAVLDVGGGPGAYATWLLEQGYAVDLVDPVPLHVTQAAARMAALPGQGRVHRGDARHLRFGDDRFDAALLLGPLYHLTSRSDRIMALTEAHRVLRPEGRIVAAAISRFASLLDGFSRGLVRDAAFRAILDRDLRDGQHRNVTDREYFTTAFFHRPEELAGELAGAGFDSIRIIAIEGPFWCLAGFDELWNDHDMRAFTMETLRRLETEAAMIGASAHILAVARKADP